jgi:hypothetical protein
VSGDKEDGLMILWFDDYLSFSVKILRPCSNVQRLIGMGVLGLQKFDRSNG